MKWKIVAGCILLLLLFGAWIGFQRLRDKGWEKMLAGPYSGSTFAGEIYSYPISKIILKQDISLEAYRAVDGDDGGKTVVLLRTQGQHLVWMRLLVIQEMNAGGTNQTRQTYLRNVLLKRVVTRGQQYKVFMTCDVGEDTNEGGLIYLDQNLQFVGFSVSW